MATYGISPLAPGIRLLGALSVAVLVFAAGLLLFLQGLDYRDLAGVLIGLALIAVSVFYASRINAPVLSVRVSGREISVLRLLRAPEILGPVKRMEVFGTQLIIYYAGGTLKLDIYNFAEWRAMLEEFADATGITVENAPQ